MVLNIMIEGLKNFFESEYRSRASKEPIGRTLDSMEMKLYSSMTRWHINAHVPEEEWISCFEAVKDTLDVKEKMDQLDQEFLSFLESKFNSQNLKSLFSITPCISSLEKHIKKFYDEKINQRLEENDDEFDVENVFQGVHSKDLIFYQRVFLPAAIFRSYHVKHPDVKRITLMQEAFSLGTGSRTEDLIPEITALCSICSTNDPEFATFSAEDIECFNKHVFLLQLADGFHLKSRIGSSESSVASKDFKNEDFPWYNPFDGTSSESEEMEIMSNACTICTKVFSKQEFLKFHMECFHTNKSSISVKFTSDGNELITSFDGGIKVSSKSSKQRSQTEPKRIRFEEPEELMLSLVEKEKDLTQGVSKMPTSGRQLRPRTVAVQDKRLNAKKRIRKSLEF